MPLADILTSTRVVQDSVDRFPANALKPAWRAGRTTETDGAQRRGSSDRSLWAQSFLRLRLRLRHAVANQCLAPTR
jgi:hypothetical protein